MNLNKDEKQYVALSYCKIDGYCIYKGNIYNTHIVYEWHRLKVTHMKLFSKIDTVFSYRIKRKNEVRKCHVLSRFSDDITQHMDQF